MQKEQTFPVDEQDDDIMVTVEMEDGTSVPCEILTIFESSGRDYIALQPTDAKGQPNADGTIYLYRYEEDADGTPSIDNIASDAEYADVEASFNELLESSFEDA